MTQEFSSKRAAPSVSVRVRNHRDSGSAGPSETHLSNARSVTRYRMRSAQRADLERNLDSFRAKESDYETGPMKPWRPFNRSPLLFVAYQYIAGSIFTDDGGCNSFVPNWYSNLLPAPYTLYCNRETAYKLSRQIRSAVFPGGGPALRRRAASAGSPLTC